MIYNYITTNIINGKQYIGMHSSEDIDDKYLGSGIYLKRAVSKYKKENFKKDIICICETIDEAYNNEEILIGKYNTLYPNGYNISPTGGFIKPGWMSEESKSKMKKTLSIMMSGEGNAFYGKHHSEETKEILRNKAKDRPSAFKNKKHTKETLLKLSIIHSNISEETREKMRLARLGKPSNRKDYKHSEETKQNMRHPHKSFKRISPTKETLEKRKKTRELNKLLKSTK